MLHINRKTGDVILDKGSKAYTNPSYGEELNKFQTENRERLLKTKESAERQTNFINKNAKYGGALVGGGAGLLGGQALTIKARRRIKELESKGSLTPEEQTELAKAKRRVNITRVGSAAVGALAGGLIANSQKGNLVKANIKRKTRKYINQTANNLENINKRYR